MASRTDARLLKTTKFPPEFSKKVDMQKVNLGVMKKWIASRISEILGNEDDVVIEMCFNLVDGPRHPDIKALQIQLTGFLDKDTATFCKELWKLFLSAQDSPQGVPKELLEAKKLELMQEKLEQGKASDDARKRRDESERRDRNMPPTNDRERRDGPRDRGDNRPGRGRVLLMRGEIAGPGAHTTAIATYHVDEMDHSVDEMGHSGDETADRSALHPLHHLDPALRRAAARALRPDAETHLDVVLRSESDQGLDPARPDATRIVLAGVETETDHLLLRRRGRIQKADPVVGVDPRPHRPRLAVLEVIPRQAAAAAGAGAGPEVEAGPGHGRVGAPQMSRRSDEEAGNRRLVGATAPRHLRRGAVADDSTVALVDGVSGTKLENTQHPFSYYEPQISYTVIGQIAGYETLATRRRDPRRKMADKQHAAAAAAAGEGGSQPTTTEYKKSQARVRELVEKRRLLERRLNQVEEGIAQKESAYLENTPSGNIITGFDNYMKGISGAAAQRRKTGPMDLNRVFSRSSISYRPNVSESTTPGSTPGSLAPTPVSASFSGSTPNAGGGGGGVGGGSKNPKKKKQLQQQQQETEDSENDTSTSKKRTAFGASRK